MSNIKKVKPSGIFTNYIFKSIPLAFDESMSYYETLCGVLNLLKNTVDVVNNNAEILAELESYVNNYFDNLDVQEEINNKLDEMAESGQLEEIISQYLNSTAIFGYDNVQTMKDATNLINGSYARTLGYYTKNDNGGGLYKIRQVTNDDVIDNGSIIPLTNDNLIAELIIENGEVNVNQFGAKGDNNTDDSLAIQNAINYSSNKGYKNIKLINYRYYCESGLTITTPEFKIFSTPLTEYANGLRFDTSVNVGIDVKSYGFKMENIAIVESIETANNNIIGLRLLRPTGNNTYDEIEDAMNIDADIINCSFLWLRTAIEFKGRNVNIDTCEFAECQDAIHFGILANGHSHRDIWIRNSRFHNIGARQRETLGYDYGIAIVFPDVWNRADCYGNIIRNNFFDYCNNIFTGCILGCTISDNNVLDCLHNGIVALNPNDTSITSNNEISVMISNNNINLRGNDANYGIYLKGVSRPRITGNVISNQPTICLFLEKCSTLWLTDNVLFSSRADITENLKIIGASGDEVFVSGNMFTSFQNANNTFANISGVSKVYTGINVNTGSGTQIVSNVTPLKIGEDNHIW